MIQALKSQFPRAEGQVIYLPTPVSPLTSGKLGDTHTPEASAAAQLEVAAFLQLLLDLGVCEGGHWALLPMKLHERPGV